MKGALSWALYGLGLCAQLAGCAAAPRHNPGCPLPLPVTERGVIEPHVSAAFAGETPGSGKRDLPYRGLSAFECQCRAARSSGAANLLEAQARAEAARQHQAHAVLPSGRRSGLYQAILGYSADELRNRAAGTALELYFRLVEAEGRADLLTGSLGEVGDLLATPRELHAKGLRPAGDVEAVLRQQSELRSDEVELHVGSERLNAQLQGQLGLAPGPAEEYHLWPTTPLVVEPHVIDVDRSVADGLANRAELNLLRAAAQQLNAHTLPAARLVLGLASPLLAGSPQGPAAALAVVVPHRRRDEVEATHAQLQRLLEDREKQVVREVREAALVAGGRLGQIPHSHQRVELARAKVAELGDQAEKGVAAGTVLTQARLDLLKARGDLLRDVVTWEIARVRLRQAQGLLWLECQMDAAAGSQAECLSEFAVTDPRAARPAGRTPQGRAR